MNLQLIDLLRNSDIEKLVEMATQKKSVMSKLLARTFELDETIRMNAVTAIGEASTYWINKDKKFTKNFCRRLFWMLNDESGNMGWSAPYVLGEILARNVAQLAEFIPLLLAVLEERTEEAFILGTLWALGRIGPIGDDFIQEAQKRIRPFLYSTHAEIQKQAQESYSLLVTKSNTNK